MMIVEDNGAYYIVKSVFEDKVIGPFDNKEDAERWVSAYRQAEFLIKTGSPE